MQTASPPATSASTRPMRTDSNLAKRSYLDSFNRASPPAGQGRVIPATRGADPRALARARRLPRVAAPPRGRPALRLLRGAADRQRAPRLAPRPGARVQGRVPPLQDDARLLLR